MPKKIDKWKFDKVAAKCEKAIHDQRQLDELLTLLEKWNEKPNRMAVGYALNLKLTFGDLWIWNALARCKRERVLAFRYFHLTMRVCVLCEYVALVHWDRRFRQFATETPAGGRRQPIMRYTAQEFAALTMTGATCYSLREDEIGGWVFESCVQHFRRPEPFVEQDATTTSPVGRFLHDLYLAWREKDLTVFDRTRPAIYGPYFPVLEAWADDEMMRQVIRDLADLHLCKAVNYLTPNYDGIYCLAGWLAEFPAELLFLQRVRRDFGFDSPLPSHPLLDSPFAHVPDEAFASGYDEYLDATIKLVTAADPTIPVPPWELRFQSLGPDDPLRIRLV